MEKAAISIMNAAIDAVKPANLMRSHLVCGQDYVIIFDKKYTISEGRKLKIISIGKAGCAMARSTEDIFGKLIDSGICITKYGHAFALKTVKCIESAHPVPDENSVKAAELLLDFVADLSPDDLVLVLLSGGASSLVLDLPEGINLREMKEVYELLIKGGAGIREMNIVRKHLSVIKGGGLGDAIFPSELITLAISDVIGDDPSVIGSGITYGDDSNPKQATEILKKYNIWDKISETVRHYLIKTRKTNKPHQEFLETKSDHYHIIGNNMVALEAAQNEATKLGFNAYILGADISAEINELKNVIADKIMNYNADLPCCLIWGGEPTVKVNGHGKGGRNQHLVLSVLEMLIQEDIKNRFILLSSGTDGTDGPTDAAGAYIDENILKKAKNDPTELQSHLIAFDAYHFFERYGGLIKTGPTFTNVMDVIIVLISKE